MLQAAHPGRIWGNVVSPQRRTYATPDARKRRFNPFVASQRFSHPAGVSLMKRLDIPLMKQLAIPLGCPKTATKWLVIGCQPKSYWPGTRKTTAKSLVMLKHQHERMCPVLSLPRNVTEAKPV